MNLKSPKTVYPLLMMVIAAVGGCAADPIPADRRIETRTQPVTRTSSEHQCLALAMYWEARGEGQVGMQAVGEVVLNRVQDPRFPATSCAVVKQGGETPPCQFSWWCDGKSDRPKDLGRWQDALWIANSMQTRHTRDITKGALFFHSTSVDPQWKYQRVAKVGNHVFYK